MYRRLLFYSKWYSAHDGMYTNSQASGSANLVDRNSEIAVRKYMAMPRILYIISIVSPD